VKRIAVIQHQGGTGGQAADQPVPHHPPAGGEVEDRVLAFKVGVQHQFFEVVNQDAAGALHHALGQAGGARRIHDVERMIERQLGEIDLQPVRVRFEVTHQHGIGDGADIRVFTDVGDHDQSFPRMESGR
jgi:hypothetical protein